MDQSEPPPLAGSPHPAEPQTEPAHPADPHPPKNHDRSFVFIVGITCAIIGAAASFIIPRIVTAYQDDKTTKVVMNTPANNKLESNSGFGASGYITGPKPGEAHELWLVVFSGGGYYPYGVLNLDGNDHWQIAADKICPAVGFQNISIYEVPTKDDGNLSAYVLNGSKHLYPLPGGLPLTAVRKAIAHVEVRSIAKACSIKA
jgi:hypothetical protein